MKMERPCQKGLSIDDFLRWMWIIGAIGKKKEAIVLYSGGFFVPAK
jgi:hypothetical protein